MTIVPVITIDGPSGVGKGTVSKALAKLFQWHLLDSGAIYRVLALAALRHKIAINNEDELVLLAKNIEIIFQVQSDQLTVLWEDEDVSNIIRNDNIGNTASHIAAFSSIRELLLPRQCAFRTFPGLIADGRDMGTVVFPDAPVKIFLNASLQERAHRRMQQLQNKGFSVNFEYLLSEVHKRDNRDRNRAVAPLLPATDALVLDSTFLTINDLIIIIHTYAKKILA